jgi:hypothetical protein
MHSIACAKAYLRLLMLLHQAILYRVQPCLILLQHCSLILLCWQPLLQHLQLR